MKLPNLVLDLRWNTNEHSMERGSAKMVKIKVVAFFVALWSSFAENMKAFLLTIYTCGVKWL